jgi:hypothetical protein
MVETLIAKVGRETFQGIANRLTRAAERRAKADAHPPPRLQEASRSAHDYLHIFFHPDCDRRLWLRTRSADPAAASDTSKIA